MHGKDPTAWQTWNADVFKKARAENKLIFVSIGYFSCHWCHVMQRESYQNAKIAGKLNRYFIPVKVDRELHPALDAKLIAFVQATRGYSGWPLNVFITPDGYPLVGFVYLQPDNFNKLLDNLQLQWQLNHAGLSDNARKAAKALEKPSYSLGTQFEAGLNTKLISAYIKACLTKGDDMQGGFGQQNKFPNVPQMLALLQAYQSKKTPALKNFLLLTLDQMASQGLFDQLRGGFYRYTVDTHWQTPHFEKMLYDNAQLSELYILAAQIFSRPDYQRIAIRTLDFMQQEMLDKRGALIASLSAVDDKNVEGGYYLWSDALLKKLFSAKELKVIRLLWNMKRPAPLTEGHLPVIAYSAAEAAKLLKLPEAQVQAVLNKARTILLQQQAKRKLPKDNKLLAAWNGLALRTFSLAAQLKHKRAKQYQQIATGIRNYLLSELWDGKDLIRARSGSGSGAKALASATLEDYAYVSWGLYTWASLNNKQDDLRLVQKILNRAWQRFYSKKGWRLTDDELIVYGGEESVMSDSALASPSAILSRVSLQLGMRLQDKQLMQKSLSALNTSIDILKSDPYWFATQIRTIDDYQSNTLMDKFK